MHNTSETYRRLLSMPHVKQTRLAIGESTRPEDAFDESMLCSIKTSVNLFSEDTVVIGSCVSGEIDITMLEPSIAIPKRAKLVPYVRLTDGTTHSEWIQKGVYYIDTRQVQDKGTGVRKLIIHGYDSMLKAEQDYAQSSLDWPARDIDVVNEIADALGVAVDSRTTELLTQGYKLQLPSTYTYRETLGYIAAMYAGCFIMSDLGELRLVAIWDLPEQFAYLVTEEHEIITAGGVRIRVW